MSSQEKGSIIERLEKIHFTSKIPENGLYYKKIQPPTCSKCFANFEIQEENQVKYCQYCSKFYHNICDAFTDEKCSVCYSREKNKCSKCSEVIPSQEIKVYCEICTSIIHLSCSNKKLENLLKRCFYNYEWTTIIENINKSNLTVDGLKKILNVKQLPTLFTICLFCSKNKILRFNPAHRDFFDGEISTPLNLKKMKILGRILINQVEVSSDNNFLYLVKWRITGCRSDSLYTYESSFFIESLEVFSEKIQNFNLTLNKIENKNPFIFNKSQYTNKDNIDLKYFSEKIIDGNIFLATFTDTSYYNQKETVHQFIRDYVIQTGKKVIIVTNKDEHMKQWKKKLCDTFKVKKFNIKNKKIKVISEIFRLESVHPKKNINRYLTSPFDIQSELFLNDINSDTLKISFDILIVDIEDYYQGFSLFDIIKPEYIIYDFKDFEFTQKSSLFSICYQSKKILISSIKFDIRDEFFKNFVYAVSASRLFIDSRLNILNKEDEYKIKPINQNQEINLKHFCESLNWWIFSKAKFRDFIEKFRPHEILYSVEKISKLITFIPVNLKRNEAKIYLQMIKSINFKIQLKEFIINLLIFCSLPRLLPRNVLDMYEIDEAFSFKSESKNEALAQLLETINKKKELNQKTYIIINNQKKEKSEDLANDLDIKLDQDLKIIRMDMVDEKLLRNCRNIIFVDFTYETKKYNDLLIMINLFELGREIDIYHIYSKNTVEESLLSYYFHVQTNEIFNKKFKPTFPKDSILQSNIEKLYLIAKGSYKDNIPEFEPLLGVNDYNNIRHVLIISFQAFYMKNFELQPLNKEIVNWIDFLKKLNDFLNKENSSCSSENQTNKRTRRKELNLKTKEINEKIAKDIEMMDVTKYDLIPEKDLTLEDNEDLMRSLNSRPNNYEINENINNKKDQIEKKRDYQETKSIDFVILAKEISIPETDNDYFIIENYLFLQKGLYDEKRRIILDFVLKNGFLKNLNVLSKKVHDKLKDEKLGFELVKSYLMVFIMNIEHDLPYSQFFFFETSKYLIKQTLMKFELLRKICTIENEKNKEIFKFCIRTFFEVNLENENIYLSLLIRYLIILCDEGYNAICDLINNEKDQKIKKIIEDINKINVDILLKFIISS